MSGTWIDLSGKIDPEKVDAVRHVKKAADLLGIPFVVAGAAARDFLLKQFSLASSRKTEDIDLGVEVSSWEHYFKLVQELESEHGFIRDPRPGRFMLGGLLLDIIPFGAIAGPENKISWPADNSTQMNMTGFAEALRFSISMRIDSAPDLIVQVVSAPGLVALKLISWRDRYPERTKDALDLIQLVDQYEGMLNLDWVYKTEGVLLESHDYDLGLVSIMLLGIAIATMIDEKAYRTISGILGEETWRRRLILDMNPSTRQFHEGYSQLELRLDRLVQGIHEGWRRRTKEH